ncbi:MAG: hypothetical protein NVSMB26_16770 [Beijerinckiaceae bacterium]
MKDKPPPPNPPPEAEPSEISRESFKHGRLAAALRENLARRKRQASARKSLDAPACPPGNTPAPSEKDG